MTLKLTVGIDPGLSGAIAVLGDGNLIAVHDMPTEDREGQKGDTIDNRQLAAIFRGLRMAHSGASLLVALERVNGGSGFSKDRQRATSSTFNFGESYGMVQGVLGALSIDLVRPTPQRWKKHFGLIGQEKDAARECALGIFPRWQAQLARKKDGGRADAILIAYWAWRTEAAPHEPLEAPIFRQAIA